VRNKQHSDDNGKDYTYKETLGEKERNRERARKVEEYNNKNKNV